MTDRPLSDILDRLTEAGNAFRGYALMFQNEGEPRWRARMDVAEEHAAKCFAALAKAPPRDDARDLVEVLEKARGVINALYVSMGVEEAGRKANLAFIDDALRESASKARADGGGRG